MMYPCYDYSYQRSQDNRWSAISGATSIIIVALTVGVIAIAAYNASNNHESLEIMRKQYGARSAL